MLKVFSMASTSASPKPRATASRSVPPDAPGTAAGPAPSGLKGFSTDAVKDLPLGELIDLFGPLDEQVTAMKPLVKQHEAVRQEIERRFAAEAADKLFVERGKVFEIQVLPRENKRTITSPAKLFNLMKSAIGLERLKDLCSFKLSDVDAHIDRSLHKTFLNESRSGRRPIEAVRIVAPR